MTVFTLKFAQVLGHTIDALPHSIMQVKAESVSDGYHTMDELYQHRLALTVALTRIIEDRTHLKYVPFRSKLHEDGTMFEGYFIVGIFTDSIAKPEQMIISYHYPISEWDKFAHCIILNQAPHYDGHTGQDVIERLLKL